MKRIYLYCVPVNVLCIYVILNTKLLKNNIYILLYNYNNNIIIIIILITSQKTTIKKVTQYRQRPIFNIYYNYIILYITT